MHRAVRPLDRSTGHTYMPGACDLAGAEERAVSSYTIPADVEQRVRAELTEVYDGTSYQVPLPEEVVSAVVTFVVDLAIEHAGELEECGKVDDCTAQAIVLRHLAEYLGGSR